MKNSELILVIFWDHYRKSGPFTQFAFDLNLSLMELDNFLNEGETNS